MRVKEIARLHEKTIDALPRNHQLSQYPLADTIAALLRAPCDKMLTKSGSSGSPGEATESM